MTEEQIDIDVEAALWDLLAKGVAPSTIDWVLHTKIMPEYNHPTLANPKRSTVRG